MRAAILKAFLVISFSICSASIYCGAKVTPVVGARSVQSEQQLSTMQEQVSDLQQETEGDLDLFTVAIGVIGAVFVILILIGYHRIGRLRILLQGSFEEQRKRQEEVLRAVGEFQFKQDSINERLSGLEKELSALAFAERLDGALEDGDTALIEEICSALLALDPGNPAAQLALAQSKLGQGLYKESAEHYAVLVNGGNAGNSDLAKMAELLVLMNDSSGFQKFLEVHKNGLAAVRQGAYLAFLRVIDSFENGTRKQLQNEILEFEKFGIDSGLIDDLEMEGLLKLVGVVELQGTKKSESRDGKLLTKLCKLLLAKKPLDPVATGKENSGVGSQLIGSETKIPKNTTKKSTAKQRIQIGKVSEIAPKKRTVSGKKSGSSTLADTLEINRKASKARRRLQKP